MENDIPKIAYIFGAGASAIKLPTINGLPARIKHVKDFIDQNYNFTTDETISVGDFTFKATEAKEFILNGFDKLYIASQSHSTVDTYAKNFTWLGVMEVKSMN